MGKSDKAADYLWSKMHTNTDQWKAVLDNSNNKCAKYGATSPKHAEMDQYTAALHKIACKNKPVAQHFLL